MAKMIFYSDGSWEPDFSGCEYPDYKECDQCGEKHEDGINTFDDLHFCSYECYFNYLVDVGEVERIELGSGVIKCSKCEGTYDGYCYLYKGKVYCDDECLIEDLD